jgi:hypothetical protein
VLRRRRRDRFRARRGHGPRRARRILARRGLALARRRRSALRNERRYRQRGIRGRLGRLRRQSGAWQARGWRRPGERRRRLGETWRPGWKALHRGRGAGRCGRRRARPRLHRLQERIGRRPDRRGRGLGWLPERRRRNSRRPGEPRSCMSGDGRRPAEQLASGPELQRLQLLRGPRLRLRRSGLGAALPHLEDVLAGRAADAHALVGHLFIGDAELRLTIRALDDHAPLSPVSPRPQGIFPAEGENQERRAA